MTDYTTEQALDGLRAVLAHLQGECEQFLKSPLSVAGLYLDRTGNADPVDLIRPEDVARFLGVPDEAVEQVQGVELSSTGLLHNGPFFVFLPPSPDGSNDPRREIARQLDAFDRAVGPLPDLIRRLPDRVRSRFPAEPSGWWAVLFFLALHHPRVRLRAERWRWLTFAGPSSDGTLTLRYTHERREPEARIQFGDLQPPFDDVVPGVVWTRLVDGDLFTATIAAVELLIHWLETPAASLPDPAEVHRRYAPIHARFSEYAEWDRLYPRPLFGDLPAHLRCALVKVTNSFQTPPAPDWCPVRSDLRTKRLLLSRHHADAEYLIHSQMPADFPDLCRQAGAVLPRSIPDRPVMFRRQLAPDADTLTPGPVVLNPDPVARWVRFVFNVLRERQPAGGGVEVRFIDPPGVSGACPDLYGYATLAGGFFAAAAHAIELVGLLPTRARSLGPPPSAGPLPPTTQAFIEFLVSTADLPRNTDILRLQERSRQSRTLHDAALMEVRPALTSDEVERLNLRMGRLCTLALACPSENPRNPAGSYADAYDRFVGEMEAFRGYIIALAGRLQGELVVPDRVSRDETDSSLPAEDGVPSQDAVLEEIVVPSTPTENDGPVEPDRFRYAGVEVRFGRAVRQRALVLALWDAGTGRPAAARPVDDVLNEVYGLEHQTTDDAFRQLLSGTRRRLQSHNCALDIENTQGKARLVPPSA